MAEYVIKGKALLNTQPYDYLYSQNPILSYGEVVFQTISNSGNNNIMIKVGDGKTQFNELQWVQALSSDVFDWAKQETKPEYNANEIKFKDGENIQEKYDNNSLFSYIIDDNENFTGQYIKDQDGLYYPIFTKIIYNGVGLQKGQQKEYPNGLSNVKRIIDYYTLVENNNNTFKFSNVFQCDEPPEGTGLVVAWQCATKNNVKIVQHKDFQSYNFTIFIQYIKQGQGIQK